MRFDDENENDPFAATLTDFMSGVAVIFLCLAVTYIIIDQSKARKNTELIEDYNKKVVKTKEKKDIFIEKIKSILNLKSTEAFQKLSDNCYDIVNDNYKLTIRFKDKGDCKGLSFPSKLFTLKEVNEDSAFVKIAKMACQFQKENSDKVNFFERIDLLGHTDCNPFIVDEKHISKLRGESSYVDCKNIQDKKDCGNLGLSALRARQVFLHLKDFLGDEIDNSCLQKLFNVSGRGPYEPVTDAKSCKEDINRRVEFGFFIKPPSLDLAAKGSSSGQ